MAAGIEHEQADWLRGAFAGAADEPAAKLVDPGRPTPNQRALAVAIGVAWCRLGQLRGPAAAIYLARATGFYATLSENGHQAVAPGGYGDEQGAPSPHDALWLYWRATMLREARLQGLAELYVLAIQEAAEEVALCAAFWTPAGVRMPGSRAKGAAGKPLRPSWATCSWAYALITGAPTAGLDKPDQGPIAILKDCRPAFAAIQAKARMPKLHIPVRKWALRDGGFVAALDHDEPMNDRLSWIAVDAAGEITGASDTLGDLPDLPAEPTLVFGAGAGGRSAPAAILVTPKSWWRSRLMALGAGVTLYGLATFVASFAPVVASLGGRWGGLAHIALGLAVAYLRARTSRPIAGTEKAQGA